MEKIFVAKSYQNGEILDAEPHKNSKGKMVVRVKMTCPRCGGSGNYSYNEMDGTMCYGCMGAGKVINEVRAYTEKEYTAMEKANERAKERKIEAKLAKEKDLIDNAETYKLEVAKKLGFNSEGKMYIICGGDTYAIKDQLKALGARFDYNFKWFLSNPVDLPEGYQLCEFSFDELYDYEPRTKWATLKNNVKDIIKGRLQELETTTDTKYYPAEIKDKISVQATLTAIRGFDSMYGYTYIYTFTLDEYVFVWMTTKDLGLDTDTIVNLSGTIKGFEEYNGVAQTQVTRCKVSAVAAA